MILLAFKSYKDGGTIAKMVRNWQKYDYVHTELVFTDKNFSCFSANTRFQGHWSNKVDIHQFGESVENVENWLFYKLPISDIEAEQCWNYANSLVGKEYNTKGLIGMILNKNINNPDERHCSEACYDVIVHQTSLNFPVYPQHEVTPEMLHKIVLERHYQLITINQ
jgi:hypothetical protein